MATVAAIDCGTHSTRLLISRIGGEANAAAGGARGTVAGANGTNYPTAPQILERCMTITNLGEDFSKTGRLKDEAIARTSQCLASYRQLMDTHQVEAFRVVATSAARDAANTDQFFDAVAQVLGQPPELLSGEAEARLSFKGAVSQLNPQDGPYLVCDIGGGSTEFGYGSQSCEAVWSADVGSSRLTQQYIEHDPPLPEELVACLSVVELHLDDLLQAMPTAAQASQLVGLAGTVTTAAAVELGLAQYDPEQVHHFLLSKAAAEDVFRTLAVEDHQQRLANPGLHPGRVDVIVGGLCVLVKIMRYFEFDSCLVSEADLLAGLIAEMDI